MHCVYDAPDEEENAIGVVDEDNQTSISDAGPWYESNGSHNRDFEYVYV
jgi:hypothetical protein